MEEEGKFISPSQYNIDWGVIAISLLVLITVFYVVVFLATRKKKPEEDIRMLPKVAMGAERLSLIKNKYAKSITNVGEAYSSGEISQRKAFQLLSTHLRNFTHEYSGSGAYSMTLTDLYAAHAPELLLSKIESHYPGAFQKDNSENDVELAVQDALRMVQVWR